jgi:hypothetical protein
MQYRFCPHCELRIRFLSSASKDSPADYFLCDRCGRVWAYDKHHPEHPPRDITTTSSRIDRSSP